MEKLLSFLICIYVKTIEFEGLVAKLHPRAMLHDRQSRKPCLKPYKTTSNSKENLYKHIL